MVERELAKSLVKGIKEKLESNASTLQQCDVFDRVLLNTPSGPGTMEDLWEVTDWRLTVLRLKSDYLRGEVINVDEDEDNDDNTGLITVAHPNTRPPPMVSESTNLPETQSKSRESTPLSAKDLEDRDSSMGDAPEEPQLSDQGSPDAVQDMDISDGVSVSHFSLFSSDSYLILDRNESFLYLALIVIFISYCIAIPPQSC